jgi:hypothetical protein
MVARVCHRLQLKQAEDGRSEQGFCPVQQLRDLPAATLPAISFGNSHKGCFEIEKQCDLNYSSKFTFFSKRQG